MRELYLLFLPTLALPMTKSGDAVFDVTPKRTGWAIIADGQESAGLLWAEGMLVSLRPVRHSPH
jgi:hypothetical protein